MKILGHPVHAILVHFPSALFPMEFLCYIIFYSLGNPSFAYAAFFSLSAGVVIGWLAVITGALDLLAINRRKTKVLKTALLHGSLNITMLIVYTVFFFSELKLYPGYKEAELVILVIKGILVLILIAGNYLGGNLVFKYKVGIK